MQTFKMQTILPKKQVIIGAAMVCFLILSIYFLNNRSSRTEDTYRHSLDSFESRPSKRHQRLEEPAKDNSDFSVWPEYSNTLKLKHSWYVENCFDGEFTTMGISLLKDLENKWAKSSNEDCKFLYKKFKSIFTITKRSGGLVIPDTFRFKVMKWLGNNVELVDEVKHQTITLIFNEYTHEHTIFNPLRAKRPVVKPDVPERIYVEKLSQDAAKSCDFCNYKKFTAKDLDGRLTSKSSYTAANTFKYDAFHELFITERHHPLNWTQPELVDVFELALKWMKRVQSKNKSYTYPVILWDLLPHASASQVHPHLHGNMINDRYYGSMENWRLAAEKYFRQHNRNYFTDLTEIHNALGLAVQFGEATALANINPKKDHEIIIISKEPGTDFFKLIYFVLRAYIDDIEKLCFSMGLAFPRIGITNAEGDIPAFARVITRGSVTEVRSDISSLELFAASNVNIDPFSVIKAVKESIRKRS